MKKLKYTFLVFNISEFCEIEFSLINQKPTAIVTFQDTSLNLNL